jgi:phosphoribosylformylglycinamidine synthase subunit PurL
LDTPVTGGNVSLYNETFDAQGNPQPIYPTPVVGMVGYISDLAKICGQGWQNVGDIIYLLGTKVEKNNQEFPPTPPLPAPLPLPELGASEYLATIHNTVAGKPPRINFELERRVQQACRTGIHQGWVNAAHDSAEGGLVVAVAESCISGNLGAKIQLNLPSDMSGLRWDEVLFAEGGARILVSVSPAYQQAWESHLQENLGNQWQQLGVVTSLDEGLRVVTTDNQNLLEVALDEMRDRFLNAIERRLG